MSDHENTREDRPACKPGAQVLSHATNPATGRCVNEIVLHRAGEPHNRDRLLAWANTHSVGAIPVYHPTTRRICGVMHINRTLSPRGEVTAMVESDSAVYELPERALEVE